MTDLLSLLFYLFNNNIFKFQKQYEIYILRLKNKLRLI